MSRIRTWMVGRDPACDVVLDDEGVSRRHAELVRLPDGRLYVTDRVTTNGTFISDGGDWRRIRQTLLSPTDRIRFGSQFSLTGGRLDALCPRDDARPGGGAGAGGASGRGARPGGAPPPKEDGRPDPRKKLVVDPETGEVREQEEMAGPVGERGPVVDPETGEVLDPESGRRRDRGR